MPRALGLWTVDGTGIRAEPHWWRIHSYSEVVAGALGGRHTQCHCGLHAWCLGETAARSVQVRMILQNTGCSEKLCVRQREGVEDPVSLGAREPGFSSGTCQQLVGDLG